MAKQVINIGSAANDGTGDPLRDAWDKANDNFTELYNHAESTSNPHGTDKSDVGLSNVLNSVQVINEGDFRSLQAGTIGSRPAAGTANRYYYATDIHKLFRDDGANWQLESLIETVNKDANYTATLNDRYIGVTTPPITLSLPASANTPSGFDLFIKDESGMGLTDNITVSPDGSDTIDGEPERVMNTSYEGLHIMLRGTNWNILANYEFSPPS